MTAVTTGMAEHKLRVVAPAVGGCVRLEARRLRGRADRCGAGAQARRSRPMDGGSQRERGRDRAWPRPDPGHRARGRRRRQDHRGPREAAGRHGGVPATHHARYPAARRVPVPRRVRHPAVLVRVHGHLHQQDAHRRVPGRWAARGDLRHRADHRVARDQSRCRVRRDPSPQLHPARPVPVHVVGRACCSTPATTSRRSTMRSSSSATTDCARSKPTAGPPARRSTSASASPRTSRCAASHPPGCWPR